MLLDAIKLGRDLRTRQLAAMLLSRAGPRAAGELKRELALAVSAEQRLRLLEVADRVTRDLVDEVALCLGDRRPRLRRAALQLAERLNEPAFLDVLVTTAREADPALARGTIRCIGTIGTEAAVRALESLLVGPAAAEETVVACLQALGRIQRASAVDALARVLRERRFLVLGRRWPDQLRATAALALYHLRLPAADRLLVSFGRDRDPRIRRLAVALQSGDRTARGGPGAPG